jgi:hypothetical protein
MTRNFKVAMLPLSLAAVVVLLAGCQQKIVLTASDYEPGKVVVQVKQGDVIQWNGVVPIFQGPAPCTLSNQKCTVNVPDGSFLYTCKGCTDPEVVVGPTTTMPQTLAAKLGASAVQFPVSLWCNSNQVTLTPPTLQPNVSAGTSIQVDWVLTGSGNQKITAAAITPSGTNPVPCTVGTSPPYICSFNAPSSGTTYTYTASSSAGTCVGATAANGSIQF